MRKVEWRVWSRLRSRQVAGFKFRRQVPIGPYYADFACLSARLVVEVDGDTHEEGLDARKDAYLLARGYRILRVPVSQVDESLDDVVEAVYLALGLDLG
jgi:very-short-patch-repair endonuclease